MHTVALLEQALCAAQKLGYGIRHEWLESGTTGCEFAGRKWLFIDLAENAREQLHGVCEALAQDPRFTSLPLDAGLVQWVQRKAA